MHLLTNRKFLTFPGKSLDMAKQRLRGQLVFNKNKPPQAMFWVELEPDTKKLMQSETYSTYLMKYWLHHRITVEEPHKRNGQELTRTDISCQEFGQSRIAN